MAKVLRTRQAENDLLEIWECVADDSIPSADKLLDQIATACARISEVPGVGRSRPELAPSLRSFPVGNYVIFYRSVEDGIIVIRVLHGARDIPAQF